MSCGSLRTEVFEHVHRLSLGYYAKNEAGDVMSRITNDTNTIEQAMSFALIQVLSGALLAGLDRYKMFSLNWAYALISIAACR